MTAATKTKLAQIQHLQTRLSAALMMHCYPEESLLAQLSLSIEQELYELETILDREHTRMPEAALTSLSVQ